MIEPLEQIGEVAIVGGLVRDIVRYGLDRRPISDIDLVVQGSPSAVAAIAKKISARSNRFGGFGIATDQYKVDFWALSTTWARTNAGVHIAKIQDVIDGTFFNWDAITYSTSKRATYLSSNYLDDIENNFLEINLQKTASPKGNFIRALRRLIAWQANPGPKLYRFLKDGTSYYSWNDVIAQEKVSFYNSYLDGFADFNDYLRQLERGKVLGFEPEQLSLFKDEDLPVNPVSHRTMWYGGGAASDASEVNLPS